MSILIRGMKMPESCGKCFVGDRTICADGCPLVEVKEPHGRLGDLDELKTAFPRCDNSMAIKIASVRATINHAPTIIKAEGSEE